MATSLMDKKVIPITLSMNELISMCRMFKLGKMFISSPEQRQYVSDVLTRIDKKLQARDMPRETIDRLLNF